MKRHLLTGLSSLMLPMSIYALPSSMLGAYQRSYLRATTDGNNLRLSGKKRPFVDARKPDAIAAEPELLAGTAVKELVIVDAAVPDKHVLYRAAKPGVDIVEIDSTEAGLAQLTTVLARYKNLSALHIVSHAADGELLLGNSRITAENIKHEVETFAALNGALRDGGDLLLYGCDLAAGEAGEELLDIIRSNTHLDLAASNDKTGSHDLQGDWELEINTGSIEADLPFSDKALKDFSAVLAAPNGTYGFQSGWTDTGNTLVSTHFIVGAKDANSFTSLNVNWYAASSAYILSGAVSASNYFYVRADGVNTGTFELTGVSAAEYGDQFTNLRIVGILSDDTQITSATINGSDAQGETFTFGAAQLGSFSGKQLKAFKLYFDATYGPNSVLNFEFRTFTIANAQNPADTDGTLTAAPFVSEPVALASTVDTVGEAVDVFDFTIADGGTSDGQSLTVSSLFLNVSGTSTDAERSQITWRLNGPDASNVIGTYNAATDRITFSGLNINVANGGNETYTVNAYYNNPAGLTDGHTIILSINGDTNLTTGSGTRMGSTSPVTNGTGTTIDVSATQLVFTTQPAGSISGSPLTTQPVVAARDAFGNTDVHFSETITLTEASAGTLSNNTQAAVNGVATFTGLTYTATADQQAFTLTANDQDGVGSNLPTVDSSSMTSDVVATKLVFTTQPAPTTVGSGVVTSLTTVPVVSARDGNNIVDTGYSAGITLAEVNGAGSAILSATGDTDGDASTVTITPTSGVATFSGMQLAYTASGSSIETFNLRASSGGLSTADSSQLTALVNSAPTDIGLTASTIAQSSTGPAASVGTLSTTDANGSDSHTYSLVINGASNNGSCGAAGDDNNASFQVDNVNHTLNTSGSLTAGTYHVCVQTSDGSASYQKSFTITVTDDVAPTITSVSVPANATYVAGQNLDFTVNANENITVNTAGGTPRLGLTIGATTRYATYLSGTGTSSVVFRYTVQAGDGDNDGIVVDSLDSGGGTLRDSAGNNLNTALNAIGSTTGVLVDGTAPSVSSVSVPADATYSAGQNLDFIVNYDEAVIVNTTGGTPRLTLTIGATTHYAGYVSGNGTAALLFRYTVQTGDNDTNGIALSGSLQLNGATLRDSSGNDATLTLSSVGSTAAVLVDASAPGAPSTPDLVAASDTGISSTDNLTADNTPTFTGTAEADSTVTIESSRDGTLGTTTANGSGNWAFTATMLSGGTHQITATSTDGAGNTSPASAALEITIDTDRPTASIVVTDTALAAGETSLVTITFSEAVTGFTTADLTVDNGTLGAVTTSDGGITWTATLTPTAGINAATNVITLDNTGVTDAVGNTGTGTTSSNNYAVDTTTATATIVVADTELNTGETSLVTITFNKAVTGFGNDDLTFANGTLSAVSTSDGGVTWTATFTPNPNIDAPSNVITLNNAGVTDISGNPGVGTTHSSTFAIRTRAMGFVVTSRFDSGADATSAATLADDVADGAGLSLREALGWARANDTVTFDLDSVAAGSQGGTIVLNGNPLTIAYGNIAIDGDLDDDGAADVTLSGNNASRVLEIGPSLAGIEVTGLTLTAGRTAGGGAGLYIGAGSSITVRNSSITNNSETGIGGGGVYGRQATLTMINSTVSGNTSVASGGGIRLWDAASTLHLINSTVHANVTTGPGANGGGIEFISSSALTLVNSTISGNGAAGIGSTGGGLNISSSATAYLYNSTIVGNAATVSGGGVSMWGAHTYVNTVVAGNASGPVATPGANGHPLALGMADDVFGTIGTATHSYFGSATTITTNNGSLNNQGTDNLLLEALAGTGGRVPTHRPRYGSALIDAGSDAALPADAFDVDDDGNTTETLPIDARGHRRISATVEIGAVEVNDPPRAGDDSAVTNEDTAVEIVVLANDSDSDGTVNASSVTIASAPSHGSAVVNASGSITYTPAENWNGADSLTYSVADNEGMYSEAATVSITITPVNDLPVISGTPSTVVTSGTLYTFTPTLSDVDGSDTLTVSATNLPSWATLNVGTGTISGTPDASDAGTYNGIVLTVSDGTGTNSLPAFAIVVNASIDFDGDGMSDAFEELYGLDPRDPTDAAGDLDGDGISNLDEYRDNRDPTVDDYAPVLSSPAPITIDATGLLTPMPPLSPPEAMDGRDGAIAATLVGDRAYLEPGTHILEWYATDQAGNRADTLQALNVRPLISLARDQVTEEGATAYVRIMLNGPSPLYPLTVAYEVSGTAGADDHDLVTGTVVFEMDELEKSIPVQIVADGRAEGEETIHVALAGEGNFGAQRTHTIRIVEANIAPGLDGSIMQAGRNVLILTQDRGAVTLTAKASDANAGDTLTYTWSFPPEIAATTVSDSVHRFDPALVAPGTYRVEITVTDNGVPARSTRRSLLFQILASAPELSASVDSDGDGIDDAAEGLTDSDGDGQPDYLDANAAPNVLNESAGDRGMFLIEADPGVGLRLGPHALAHGADGAQLADQEIAALSTIGADSIRNVGGYFDLGLRDLPQVGASVNVVIPQRQAIPQNPLYRKFINGQWITFIENAANSLASAPGEEGVCPPPGSSDYRAGLNPGDWCVRLTIEDGGPNDADGIANGAVEDPGGVGTVNVVTSSTRGGGGAVGTPLLMLLVLLALHRLRNPGAKRIAAMTMTLALAVALPTQARADEGSLYVTGMLGYADTSISRSDVEGAFAAQNIDSTVHSVDGERIAWGVGVGYRISERWSAEAGYLDLGEVELSFDALASETDLAQVHPMSANGATLLGLYQMPLADRVTAHARLGAFIWSSEYTTRTGGAEVDTDKDSGVDLLWGIGVGYALSSAWSLTLDLQRIEFAHEPTHVIGLQAQWRVRTF